MGESWSVGGVRAKSMVPGVPGVHGVRSTSSWALESPRSGDKCKGLAGETRLLRSQTQMPQGERPSTRSVMMSARTADS